MTDRLIRITTALAVATVAAVAAVISYRHAYELVSTHGETGMTARLLPFTVDGLILAASMLILDANRRHHPVPPLARWCLGAGIFATIGANLAHGFGHGAIGALVSAWPALALAGSFELLMTLIRTEPQVSSASSLSVDLDHPLPIGGDDEPLALMKAPSVEHTVRAWHSAGHSQRAIARQLNLDRRKVKRIIDCADGR
jgi:pheromone shutdown protein TraB